MFFVGHFCSCASKKQLVLSPTLPEDYLIKEQGWTDETVTISLSTEPEAMWADVRSEDKTVEVKVVSIDTGGGQVSMPGGRRAGRGGG